MNDALARPDLRLAVKRQVVGVLGDQHLKFRSPYVLSIRPTNGQNLCVRTQGAGKAAS